MTSPRRRVAGLDFGTTNTVAAGAEAAGALRLVAFNDAGPADEARYASGKMRPRPAASRPRVPPRSASTWEYSADSRFLHAGHAGPVRRRNGVIGETERSCGFAHGQPSRPFRLNGKRGCRGRDVPRATVRRSGLAMSRR